jgi:hypothetical protein
MARQSPDRDLSPILAAAEQWIHTCLVEDGSLFLTEPRWTAELVDEAYEAFVEHPDYGKDDFLTKLKGQMNKASPSAQQLMAEMLWALLLFPSNMKPGTKRQQVREIWGLSGQRLDEHHAFLSDSVLMGIGSGGPAFNNFRPLELEFLVSVAGDVKRKDKTERKRVFSDYEAFLSWIDSVPREGLRQFRHMLRYFAFPDLVERISSNNDRRFILEKFEIATSRELSSWNDRRLDEALLQLRRNLEKSHPASVVLDFYCPPLKEQWAPDRKVKTVAGEITVTVPGHEEESQEKEQIAAETKLPDARQSFQIQAKLARIGALMGFRVWIPRGDRNRVKELLQPGEQSALIESLPLNYDSTTIDTIELIDVLWLKGRSIVRAFEVEHTTAVYSGLLRMADLLALQPNMSIRLHIVASDERREKVFREMRRPVFSLLERGPLSDTCTFISYENITLINALEHLAHTNDSIIAEYEESAE